MDPRFNLKVSTHALTPVSLLLQAPLCDKPCFKPGYYVRYFVIFGQSFFSSDFCMFVLV